MNERRWQGDAGGIGNADGRTHLPEIRPLCDALAQPGWIAEDPEIHLLPRLSQACAAAGSPWTLTAAAMGADGGFEVALTWSGAGPVRVAPRSLRAGGRDR
jgi:hypothetical protein